MMRERMVIIMKRIIAVLLGVVFIVSGCTTPQESNYISIKEARNNALNEVNGEVVKESKDLKDEENPHYTFEIVKDAKKYDVEVDALNGEILALEIDENYIPAETNKEKSEHKVTQAEAEKVAKDVAGGGDVVSVKLDHKDSHIDCVWDVEVVNGNDKYEVEVNADTKAIVSEDMSDVND